MEYTGILLIILSRFLYVCLLYTQFVYNPTANHYFFKSILSLRLKCLLIPYFLNFFLSICRLPNEEVNVQQLFSFRGYLRWFFIVSLPASTFFFDNSWFGKGFQKIHALRCTLTSRNYKQIIYLKKYNKMFPLLQTINKIIVKINSQKCGPDWSILQTKGIWNWFKVQVI